MVGLRFFAKKNSEVSRLCGLHKSAQYPLTTCRKVASGRDHAKVPEKMQSKLTICFGDCEAHDQRPGQ
jgi:hypothetical protein